MAPNPREEEGVPLAPAHSGVEDFDLPSPATGGYRRHHHRGALAKLRSKFYSFPAPIRILLILLGALLPLYYIYHWYSRLPPRDWEDPFDMGYPGEPRPPMGRPPTDRPPMEDDWVDEKPHKMPPPPPPSSDDDQSGDPTSIKWATRAQEVKDAFVHAYTAYEKYAFPADELLPEKMKKTDNFNGWGVTAVDSLDTMIMMGLTEEYERAVALVAATNYKGYGNHVPFFETLIRYFGSVLSAYDLTKDRLFLKKAEELGDALIGAFNTPSGYPAFAVRPRDGNTHEFWGMNRVILAEMGTCQLEYKTLAHLTGKKVYWDKVESIRQKMQDHINPNNHLLPAFFNSLTGDRASTKYSIGALADSGYEYVLKQYLLTARTEYKALEMYKELVGGIIEHLLYISPNRELLFATDVDGMGMGQPSFIYEHLSCFLPGMFALGAHTLDLSPEDKQLHLWIAEGLTETCYLSYVDQATGLGPEEMMFNHASQKWYPKFQQWESAGGRTSNTNPPGVHKELKAEPLATRDYTNHRDYYLLRPETLESIFIMYKVTGDEIWRQRGYEIFKAIEKHGRKEEGYAAINNVDVPEPPMKNSMPSFFLAETLKYLWLLFHDDDRFDLKKVVFNTEAHPLPIFEWSRDEIQKFQIPVQ